jgi:hypothetical protein
MDFNRVCVVDIETNTLLSKMLDYSEFPYKLNKEAKLWCVVVRNVGTGEIFSAVKEEVTKEWVEEVLKPFDVIVAHNGIKFDFIALKLFGVLDYRIGYLNEPDLAFGREVKFLDSIILSRLLNPDRYLGHSLDAWGDRVGNQKTNFRQALIDQELLDPKAPRGFEFSFYTETMLDYCIQDTSTNADALRSLLSEIGGYTGWKQGLKMEHKLADLAVRRESLGFFFDKNLAIECLEDLDTKMKAIEAEVNPILPPRPLNKGERDSFTPPKTQFKKDGSPAKYLLDFALRLGAEVYKTGTNYVLNFEGTEFPLPWEGPIKTHCEADISNLDHVKMYLIQLGWVPSEWRERDLTKDSKKQNLPYEKRVLAFDRWYKETTEGKYMEGRLSQFENIPHNMLYDITLNKLSLNKPVRVPTSPSVRVGVEKELCPNLLALGEKVAFAKDFAMWLTYRHRRSSIAGGDIEDMDFDLEYPNTGYLSVYREVDGRVPTPAIEIGAATTRYRHISVANIPRASSPYGDKMRSLFGCGKNAVQFGYDFSSLENRVQAGYIAKYPGGPEMGVALTAEKPNDLHSINAKKLNISRSDAKSFTYACLPMNTQVLTPKGWKTYDKLSEKDVVITYNEKKDCLEHDVILKKHFFTDKEVFAFQNNSSRFECTEDHRWFGWKRVFEDKKRVRRQMFFKASEINQEYNIVTSAPYVSGAADITPEEAMLMGLILSDGCISWSKRSERTSAAGGDRKQVDMSILQSQNYFQKEIETLLDKLNLQYSPHQRLVENGNHVKSYKVSSPDARKFLDRVVGDRTDKHDTNWCKWVMTLTYESLTAFVEGFFLGDGEVAARRRNPNIFIITQNEGNILDGIYLACYLVGDGNMTITRKGSGICKYIRKRPRRHITCQELKRYSLGVQDTFCLTTTNSTFVIKQEKYIGITGNCLYGAQPTKLSKMLNVDLPRGQELYNSFWEAVTPLKMLKENIEEEWMASNKQYIVSIDGRRIRTRSQHSLLNALFQSAGVVCAKYTTVIASEIMERELGLCIDPFIGEPDYCSMIEYHDEAQAYTNKKFYEFKVFDTEGEAEEFVKNWDGEQLSTIGHGKKYYVCLPNTISRAIIEATKRVEKLLDLKFELGIEWIVGKNWYECH